MPRLPSIGLDGGRWGEILNEFLRVSHHEDGTMKSTAKGDKGDPGDPGPVGPTGPTGPAGPAGDDGVTPAEVLDIVATSPLWNTIATRDIQAQRTISIVGDLHVGMGADAAMKDAAKARLDETFADLASLKGLAAHRLFTGDMVDYPGTTGTTPSGMDTEFLSRANDLKAADGINWDAIAGNHDTSPSRTAANWATVYGYAAQNWVKDLGFVRVIAVCADGATGATSTLSATTLTFLEDQLKASRKDTIILCHYPLFATCTPHPTDLGYMSYGAYASGEDHVLPDPSVRSILDKYAHARVWICGHSHSPITAKGIYTLVSLGSRQIPCINSGSPVYTNGLTLAQGTDHPRSIYVTMLDGEVQIRVRNHRLAKWETYDYKYAYPLPFERVPKGNPATALLTFDGSIVARDRQGTFTPTFSGPAVFDNKGIVLEKNTVNRVPNPVFHVDTAGWTASNASGSVPTRVTTWSVVGPASGQLTSTGANTTFTFQLIVPARTFIASAVVKNNAAAARTFRITNGGVAVSADVSVPAGGQARILGTPFTGSAATAPLSVVVTNSANGELFNLGHLQLEEDTVCTDISPRMTAEGVPLPGFTLTSGWWYRDFAALDVNPIGRLFPDQGTIVVRGRFTRTADAAGFSNYLCYHDPGGNKRIWIVRPPDNPTKVRSTMGNASGNATSQILVNDTNVHTFGLSWDGYQQTLFIDGRRDAYGNFGGLDGVGPSMRIGLLGGLVAEGVYMSDRALTELEHSILAKAATPWTWDILTK